MLRSTLAADNTGAAFVQDGDVSSDKMEQLKKQLGRSTRELKALTKTAAADKTKIVQLEQEVQALKDAKVRFAALFAPAGARSALLSAPLQAKSRGLMTVEAGQTGESWIGAPASTRRRFCQGLSSSSSFEYCIVFRLCFLLADTIRE